MANQGEWLPWTDVPELPWMTDSEFEEWLKAFGEGDAAKLAQIQQSQEVAEQDPEELQEQQHTSAGKQKKEEIKYEKEVPQKLKTYLVKIYDDMIPKLLNINQEVAREILGVSIGESQAKMPEKHVQDLTDRLDRAIVNIAESNATRTHKVYQEDLEKKKVFWGPTIINHVHEKLKTAFVQIFTSLIRKNHKEEGSPTGGIQRHLSFKTDSSGTNDGHPKIKPRRRQQQVRNTQPSSKRPTVGAHYGKSSNPSKTRKALGVAQLVTRLTNHVCSQDNVVLSDKVLHILTSTVIQSMKEEDSLTYSPVQVYGCAALRNLELYCQRCGKDQAKEAMRTVMNVMRNKELKTDSWVQLHACKALRYFLTRKTTTKEEAWEASTLTATMMKRDELLCDDEIQKNVLQCWIHIISSLEDSEDKFRLQDEFELVEHVVTVMKMFPRHHKIQHDSCWIMATFSQLIGNDTKIKDQNSKETVAKHIRSGLSSLEKAMSYYINNLEIQTNCLKCFQMFAEWNASRIGRKVINEVVYASPQYSKLENDRSSDKTNIENIYITS
eukprot:m.44310 g.44310  ORF g.44310 m.44310 type:complete len:552 (+) comp10080_c0_seq1:121-1776(+)